MTDKTLSEQICEVCGIEPKYWCSYHSCICPIQNIGKFNPKCPKQVVTKECETRSKERRYPNFENNNNNFVKLLEIVSKKASVSFCHNGTYYGCSIHYFFKDIFEAVEGTLQHNFLNTLLVQDLRNPCKPSLLEQIKQAIRKADWEY